MGNLLISLPCPKGKAISSSLSPNMREQCRLKPAHFRLFNVKMIGHEKDNHHYIYTGRIVPKTDQNQRTISSMYWGPFLIMKRFGWYT